MSVVTAKLKAGSGVGDDVGVGVAVGLGVAVAVTSAAWVWVGWIAVVGETAAGVQAVRRINTRLTATHKFFIAALYLVREKG
jgi:hypothetical protein